MSGLWSPVDAQLEDSKEQIFVVSLSLNLKDVWSDLTCMSTVTLGWMSSMKKCIWIYIYVCVCRKKSARVINNTLKSSGLVRDTHLSKQWEGEKNVIKVDGLQFLIVPDTESLLTWTQMQMAFEQNKEIDYEVSFFSTCSGLGVIIGGGLLISFCLDLG